METTLKRVHAPGFRRHSFGGSESKYRSIEKAKKSRSSKIAKSSAQDKILTGIFQMMNEHNRRLRQERLRHGVRWADKELGKSKHVPLPRRYGPSVMWSQI